MYSGASVFRRLIFSYFRKRNIRKYIKRYTTLSAETADNRLFKDKYVGKRCFIIGNGPSINRTDLSLLKDEYTFSVNQLPRNKQFPTIKTNFHLWSDPRFFDLNESRTEDMELLEIMKNVNTDDNTPIVFYDYSAKKMIEKYSLSHCLDIRYFATCPQYFNILGNRYIDFTKVIPDFSTVVHIAICLAVYMGFTSIYLVGCDCSGFISTAQAKLKNAENSEYGYSISENEKKRMERVSNMTSIRDELAWYVNIFDTYKSLADYCKSRGVALYNATKDSLLENIDSVDYESLF